MTESKKHSQKINLKSKEDIREYLIVKRLIDREMAKPSEDMDTALVDECFAYLQDLISEGADLEEAALEAKYREILGAISNTRKTRTKTPPISKRHKATARNFFIILAASLILLLGTLTIVAKQQGYRSAWDLVTQKVNEIFDLNLGDTMEENGITLIVDEQRMVYDSIDALLKAENLDILYPTALPEGITYTSVHKQYHNDSEYALIFRFNRQDTSMVVKNYYSFDFSNADNYTKYDIGSYRFYIKDLKKRSISGNLPIQRIRIFH